ncbi:unnamed protein product [Thlaspi arvense]|uniref:Uncharacterized protein n=1 Tax=Thlaspi arvense TaxID=13288 RepID=A0AAU9SE24_THLAR|nr:unnamed protein product [Thlaspi arvense]
MSLTLKPLLLLLLLLVLSHHACSVGSIVKFLPGFEGPLPFELETGYIELGEEEEVQLFYYFIKSEKNPKEDPLLIWLIGGPGCSSLAGLFFENGPVTLKFGVYNGSVPSLVSTTYSWTKWLSEHPQFFPNPFYVAGDSYSGMIVPAVVQEISKGNYICCKPLINLQGYVLGNPITYAAFEKNYRIPFAHGMSLISDELYESMRRNCKGNYGNVDPRNTKCLKVVEEYHKCTDKINSQHILIPDCDDKIHTNHTSPDCYKGHWQRYNWTIPYDHDIKSSVPYHMRNSISGYRSLVYSGDHDITMPFQATQAWIKSLNYPIIDDWRPWMIKDQIAGHTITYSNKMTFATVKASLLVDTRQSINQTRPLSCFKGGSVAILCNRGSWP